jgi:hypothetical protein
LRYPAAGAIVATGYRRGSVAATARARSINRTPSTAGYRGEVIVHCAGSSKGDEQKTRTLVSAAKDARHIVLISVVGADRIP